MTPLDCATDICDFIQEELVNDNQYIREYHDDGSGEKKAIHAYIGFLPYAHSNEEAQTLCPAIVVRPTDVTDKLDDSIVRIRITVTTYDEDTKEGFKALYHLLEWLRMKLLTKNEIKRRWKLAIEHSGIETTIPDEQPYPQWWGLLDCDYYISQPIARHIEI